MIRILLWIFGSWLVFALVVTLFFDACRKSDDKELMEYERELDERMMGRGK